MSLFTTGCAPCPAPVFPTGPPAAKMNREPQAPEGWKREHGAEVEGDLGKGVSGRKKERGQGLSGSCREWGPRSVRDVGTCRSWQAGRGLAQPPPRREREAEMLGVWAARVSASAGPILSSLPMHAPDLGNGVLGLGLSSWKKKRCFQGCSPRERRGQQSVLLPEQNSSKGLPGSLTPRLGWCAAGSICPQPTGTPGGGEKDVTGEVSGYRCCPELAAFEKTLARAVSPL